MNLHQLGALVSAGFEVSTIVGENILNTATNNTCGQMNIRTEDNNDNFDAIVGGLETNGEGIRSAITETCNTEGNTTMKGVHQIAKSFTKQQQQQQLDQAKLVKQFLNISIGDRAHSESSTMPYSSVNIPSSGHNFTYECKNESDEAHSIVETTVRAVMKPMHICFDAQTANTNNTKMNCDGVPPAKKKRQQPNKKWTDVEVESILDFLQQEASFEAPTAQFFYKKFIEKYKVDATWDLVRWKVRHLKSQFAKANDWLSSTGAGVMEADGGSIDAKVLKLCPHYNRLREIFGKRAGATIEPVVICTDLVPDISPCSPSPASQDEVLLEIEVNPTISATLPPEVPTSSSTPRSIRVAPQKSAIGQLTILQRERIEIEERKVKLEERKFEFEILKYENEEKRKREELDLKRLELEMKERIAKYEIDKKYK